jgi:hypothetical protein
MIVLGRFDISYATSAMGRFNILPREVHMKAVKRILSNLETFPKGRLIIDTTYPDHSIFPVEDHSNWSEFYPDAEEEISSDFSASKGSKVRMTVYVDTYHAHDLVTRRSMVGILVMLNNTPVRWVSTSFLPYLSFQHLFLIFLVIYPFRSVYRNLKLSSSIVAVLQASQATFVFYQLSSSIQLYFLTTQAEIVFFQLFKFNC